MEERVNINVSATDYEKSSNGIRSILTKLEEMVHEEDCFVITDSEFAFGWHFYIAVSYTHLTLPTICSV